MILGVFAIYDSKVSVWLSPMFFRNKGEALRGFVEAANNPETRFGKHPEDYVLFDLGSWNDETAVFEFRRAPESLGIAIEFVKKD